MKTFKDIISELTDPTPRRQKEFIDKHTVQIIDYPAGKPDQLSVKNIKKDKSKKASLHDGEDASVYEETMSDAEMKKREDIVKGMKKNKADFQKRYGDRWKSVMYATATKSAMKEQAELDEAVEVSHDRYMRSHGKKASGGEGNWMFTHKRMGDANVNDSKEVHSARGKFSDAKKSAQQWAKKHGHSTVYVMEEADLDEENNTHVYLNPLKGNADPKKVAVIKGRVTNKHLDDLAKKHNASREDFEWGNDKWNAGVTKEEVELDEVSDKKLDAYRQKAFADQPAGDDGSDKYRKRKFGRDLAFAKQTGRAKVLATKEEVALDEVSQETLRNYHAKAALDLKSKREKLDKGTLTSKDYKQGQNRVTGLNRAANKMEEYMDEAFKAGAMKLSDGSSVKLTSEQASTLNALFNQLNSSNKTKMNERLMSDSKGFDEILAFAKEAV
jgi:hypothetical protein